MKAAVHPGPSASAGSPRSVKRSSGAKRARLSATAATKAFKVLDRRISEYGHRGAHINVIDSNFIVFKREMKASYPHCGEKHLCPYLPGFDFHHNAFAASSTGDAPLADRPPTRLVGRHLTDRDTSAW